MATAEKREKMLVDVHENHPTFSSEFNRKFELLTVALA
jgi:hypothetical protein